jgi:hypothetical protein
MVLSLCNDIVNDAASERKRQFQLNFYKQLVEPEFVRYFRASESHLVRCNYPSTKGRYL